MATDYTQYLANRKLNIAEQKQQNIQKAHEQAVLAEQQRQEQLQKEISERNVFERVGETALDIFGTLGKGLFGLGEGVVDAGASVAGFVGQIFGDTQWAEDFVSFNATEEWLGKPLDNATKGSYMNDTFVEDVVEGIGQMLPTIGLMVAAPFTGGASLAGVPYTIAGTVTSAGGKGVEEALNEDAEFNQAFGYGLINAGIEFAIESVTAGMGKGITSIGKSVGKDTAKSAAKSLGKVVLEEAASEAIEEGLTEFLNPLAKGVTYKDFDEEMKRYGDAQLYKDTGYAALVGGTVGGITAGAGGIAGRVSAGGKSGYSIQQSVSEISTLDKKSDNLFNRGKIDAESIQTIRSQQQAELNNISTQLKQMTSEQRIKTINEYNLNKQFNESGDIISNTQTNSKNKPLISAETNIEAYTPSLVNADLKLAPTTSLVSEASKSAKQIVTTLDSNMRVVITDADVYNGSKFNAFYDQDNRVVYLNNKSTKTDVMKAVAVHELTHSLEGTKQYNKFSKYVKDMFSVEEWNSMLANKVNQYSKVNQAVKSGELGDVVAIREAETEIIAEYAGELLSNEQSIKRIATQNASLAVRVYEWIKQTVGKLTKKSSIKGEEYNFLRKAEKLYADALKNSVGGYSLSEFKQNIENRLKETKKIKADEKTNTETADARYSLNTDSEGNKLSSKQIEFFKDSKVRDENGRLLSVYHNSPNSFTVFDKNKIGSSTDYGAFGRGFYFGNSKWSNYGNFEYEVYLNIKNPFIIKGVEEAYNFRNKVLELAKKTEYDDITSIDMDAMTKQLIKEDYDGVIFEYGFDKTRNEYIAFEANQIKNIDNTNPTLNEDIRYSLSDNIVDNSKRKGVELDNEIKYFEELRNRKKTSGDDTKLIDEILEGMYAKRRNYGLSKNQWNISKDSEEFIKQLQDGTEQLETKESREKYEQILKKSDSFREVSVKDLRVKVIYKNAYAKILRDIETENKKIGIATEFYTDDPTQFGKDTNIGGFYDVARKVIYLPVNNSFYDFVEVNRHERIHFLSGLTDFEAIIIYKDEVLDSLTEQENMNLFTKYSQLYPFLKNNKVALFEEVVAQVYNGAEELSNLKAQDSAKEKLNDAIKKKFGLSEIRFSLENEVDSSGKKLSEGQKKFFKDSKVRDENGNLIPAYHGTDTEFNVFERKEIGKNFSLSGNERIGGFYFTNSKSSADYYGRNGRVGEYYLNITNPYILNAHSDWFNGADYFDINSHNYLENAIEKKHDGIIVKHKHGDLYVAFHSNQIKNIDNTSPTLNEDVRFSIVDGNKDLVAIHNISGSKLESLIDLGGIPVPSIAITKVDIGLENFGEISLVFNKDTIDPKNSKNKIFEADAYTRRFPRIEVIDGKQYIDLNKDPFYSDGRRRPLSYTHAPLTLENILKYMTRGNVAGSENFMFGPGQLRANLSKNFKSIAEIKDSSKKLISENEMASIKDFSNEEFWKLQSELENQLDISEDWVNDILSDLTKQKELTNDSINNFIESDLKSYKRSFEPLSVETTDRIINLFEVLKNSPTEYFEAKPQRIVGFDEIKAIIMPKEIDADIKSKVEGLGIPIYEYVHGEKRTEIINKIEDVRFNLSDGEGDYKYSKGQISKYIAEHSKPKSYAKVDAEKVINTIVNNTLTFGDKYGEIANKTKNQVVDMFWHSLNTRDEGYRAKAVLDIADYLIENSVAESVYKGDADSESASYIINNLRPYLRKIDLTSLKGEIAHKYDTDKSVYARWGKRKGTQGMGVDTIAQDLIDSGIQINATTDADIFFEIDQMYRDSLAQLKSKTKESLSKVGSTEEISQLRQTIARELLNAWDDVGKKTKFQTTIDKYTGRISTLKNALKEVKATNKITNQIIDVAREARDIVKRNYKESAGVLKDDRVKAMMKIVSGFNRANSTIIASDIRNKISQLSSVYTQNNLGQFSTDTEFGAINSDFDPNIRDAIDFLMNNKSTTLTSEELKALRIVSKGILHLYKNYDKMTYQGKLQEVSAVAESGMGVVERTAKMKSKNGVFSKMFDSVNKKFLINATDPLTAITSMEGYDSNGVITQSMTKVMEGDTNAQVAYAELMMPFEEFYKKNKKYRKRLNESVSVNTDKGEIKITVNEAAVLYGWAQREQSNIYIEGFKVTSKDGSTETYFITPTDIDNLYDSLTDADKNFIELARKMFNEQARDMKVKTDEQLKGYSVTEETNWYIPIKRDQSQIATELGSVKGYIQDFATADNMSFNKATVRGARGALRLQNMTSLVESHARGVSTYYGLAVPLKNFNKVWNKRILVGDKLVSIKEVVHDKIWSGGNEYLGKFFNDLQGVRKGGQNRLLKKMRGSYAKFQLAFNVGTVLKQTASFGMAYTYLDVGSLARGLAMKADVDTMFKYAPITKARMFDRSVVKAQGLIDNLGTASDAMTKPIQLMDNAVVLKLWNAAQVQVQKDMGYKIGTEQNLIEAGKLLEKVVRETQSNAITSERSAMSRSDSFLVSSFTMFMSDAQKQFSRLYESVGKVNALKWRMKNGESGLQQEYKQARKKLNRSLTGVTMSALIVAMVNKFMRWLLGREDKDNFWEGLGSDMIGQFFGLLPIVREFYGYLTDDYEINNYALGMINDSADAIKGIWTVSEKLISGQYVAEHEINKPVRNLLYTFGQFTGIPFRNMYNLYYGVLDKFSPSEALKLKSLFYGNNGYSAALKDAVDKGDLRNADKIVALMLEDKTGKVRDDNVIEATRYLVSQGYNPMPKSLNKKITYNSEEINLTARQHAEFSKIYEQSNNVIKSMVNSSRFERLDDSAKARAMKMVYDYYYNLGLENLIGESLDNKAMLFASGISIDQLAMAVAQAQTYEANVDKLGNVITGSKKYKIQQFINSLKLSVAQKYMIMGYLGYSNKNGAGIVKAYVNRLKLSKDEKQELYLMSGYKQ